MGHGFNSKVEKAQPMSKTIKHHYYEDGYPTKLIKKYRQESKKARLARQRWWEPLEEKTNTNSPYRTESR